MRSLPRAVATTAIGTSVSVELVRKGETKSFSVTIGRLPEDEEDANAAKDEGKVLPEPEAEPEREDLLGLSLAPLTADQRKRYGIAESVEGVVVVAVEPNSPAAQKDVKAGDVIVEVTQEKVRQPQDVRTRLSAVRKSGRRSVLFLLSDGKGELRFVAVPAG
jgi:serine protease Do